MTSLPAMRFLRELRVLVLVCWCVPPFFGLGFLVLVVEMFTVDQLVGMMLVPPLPLYVLAAPALADAYFRRFSRPITTWLEDPDPDTADAALTRARRFTLDFWILFLGYLVLAPVMVMTSAQLGTDFRPRPVDWFRIELVSLIVSIVVGLPIFFMVIDLFGEAFRPARITRPHLTVGTKVFLIGALVPLLIDTMLVQYYWTETGYFTLTTFFVWLVLELMAVAGALLFVRSFRQSLSPLSSIVSNQQPDVASLAPRSTDELGVLSVAWKDLLSGLQLQTEITTLKNALLRTDRASLASAVTEMAQVTAEATGAERIVIVLRAPGEPAQGFSSSGSVGSAARLLDRGTGQFGPDEVALEASHDEIAGVLVAHGPLKDGASDVLAAAAPELASLAHHIRVQDQMRRAERRYRELNELAPDGIVVLGEQLEILEANPVATSLLGGSPVGCLLVDRVSRHDRDETQQGLERAMGGTTAAFEVTLDGDDAPVPVEIRARRLDLGGPRILAVIRDVTERQGLQQQLVHSQRMEGVGRLAGGIAHDFNNILTAIVAGATFLQEDLGEADPRCEEANLILEQADRAARLTSQLLAFSRKQVLTPKAVSVSEVLVGATQLLSRLLPKNVVLQHHLDDGDWRVRVDPLQLEQVLMNLVVNAADAMPQGGTIRLSTGQQLVADGSWVSIVVTDDGDGIDEQHLDQIFEPYFTTKPVGKGTGLGLSTAYGIVRQSGGTMEVRSQVGAGTTFDIRLPRTLAHPPRHSPPPQMLAPERPLLLVDDDDLLRSVMRRALIGGGFSLVEASNGEEALAILERQPVSMLISDIVMPGMLGTELVTRARALHPGLSVLLISGFAEDDILDQIRDEGLDVLCKPFTPSELLQAVRRYVDPRPEPSSARP